MFKGWVKENGLEPDRPGRRKGTDIEAVRKPKRAKALLKREFCCILLINDRSLPVTLINLSEYMRKTKKPVKPGSINLA